MSGRSTWPLFRPSHPPYKGGEGGRPASERLQEGRERALARQVEIVGKSGNLYRYTALEEDRILPPAGANYIICKPAAGKGVDILYAGETDSLARLAWRDQLAHARDQYGDDADVLTRLNVRSAVRVAEQEDVIEEHQPPMNREARA